MDDNFTIFIQIIYIAINYFSFALKKKKSQIIFPILYKSTSHCYINQISDNSLQKKKKERKNGIISTISDYRSSLLVKSLVIIIATP